MKDSLKEEFKKLGWLYLGWDKERNISKLERIVYGMGIKDKLKGIDKKILLNNPTKGKTE